MYIDYCPICGTHYTSPKEYSSAGRCIKCQFPLKDVSNKINEIIDIAHDKYNLSVDDITQFYTHINNYNAYYYNDYEYYKKMQSRLSILNNDCDEIALNIKKIDGSNSDLNEISYKLNNDDTYILYLIYLCWKKVRYDVKSFKNTLNYPLFNRIELPNVPELNPGNYVFKTISLDCHNARRGYVGETKFKNHIKPDSNLSYILSNVFLRDPYGDIHNNKSYNQMDIVIINRSGVFIPEVKNYSNNFVIDDKGYVHLDTERSKHIKNKDRFNIVNQIHQHKNAMDTFLVKNHVLQKHIPVSSMIVNANDEIDPKSKCPNITIYGMDNVFASKVDKFGWNLTKSEMTKIKDKIVKESNYIKHNNILRLRKYYIISKLGTKRLELLLYYMYVIFQLNKINNDIKENHFK